MVIMMVLVHQNMMIIPMNIKLHIFYHIIYINIYINIYKIRPISKAIENKIEIYFGLLITINILIVKYIYFFCL